MKIRPLVVLILAFAAGCGSTHTGSLAADPTPVVSPSPSAVALTDPCPSGAAQPSPAPGDTWDALATEGRLQDYVNSHPGRTAYVAYRVVGGRQMAEVAAVGDLDALRTELAPLIGDPGRLLLCHVLFSKSQTDEVSNHLQHDAAYAGLERQMTSDEQGRILVTFLASPAGERAADAAVTAYGDRVRVTVGSRPWPPGAAASPSPLGSAACALPASPDVVPPGISVRVVLDSASVAPGDDVKGHLVITNTRTTTVRITSGDAADAFVVRTGTHDVVGDELRVHNASQRLLTVAPGASNDGMPFHGSIQSCSSDGDPWVAPGQYGLVVAYSFGVSGGPGRSVLLPEVPLTVTS